MRRAERVGSEPYLLFSYYDYEYVRTRNGFD
jgi:hypothetical protein